MNCQTARETLELFRQEENLPEAGAEAQRHVGECADCQEAVAARQQLDLQIGRLCWDVPVPAGLKDRLLAGIADGGSARSREVTVTGAVLPAAADPIVLPLPVASPLGQIVSRRRWLLRSSLVAICAAATAVGIWWLRPAAPTLMLGEVTNQVLDADANGLGDFKAFSRSVRFQKPKTMETAILKGLPIKRLGQQDVAAQFFDFTMSGQRCKGCLIVIPMASVIDAPRGASFLSEPSTYRQGYLCNAWVEGDLVYVCCVTCGDEALRGLMPRSA